MSLQASCQDVTLSALPALNWALQSVLRSQPTCWSGHMQLQQSEATEGDSNLKCSLSSQIGNSQHV